MKSGRKETLLKELSTMPEGVLHIKKSRGYTSFVEYRKGNKERNIRKEMDLVYLLARKKYILAKLDELNGKPKAQQKLNELVDKYVKAGLDISRITMSHKQYNWMHSSYSTNPSRPEDLIYTTTSGVKVRSKSERDIGNMYEKLGIPYRYEMALTMNVADLVERIEAVTRDYRKGRRLFEYVHGFCYWNVTPELQWMNRAGSIWKLYNSRDHSITIFPDFNPLTYDGVRLVHEHEGMTFDPYYRCNSSERVFVMRHSGAVKMDDLYFTLESDILDSKDLEYFLRNKILPRV